MAANEVTSLRRHAAKCRAKSVSAIWIVAILAGASPALAHTDEYFDSHPAPHGGQVRMSGPYHLELLIGANELAVYVTDHADNAIATVGATGSISIGTGRDTRLIILTPAGDNRFSAKFDSATAKDAVVTVAVTIPGEPTATATFVPRPANPSDDTVNRSDPTHPESELKR